MIGALMMLAALLVVAMISGYLNYQRGHSTGWNEGYTAATAAEEAAYREAVRQGVFKERTAPAVHKGNFKELPPAQAINLTIHPNHFSK